MEQQLHDWIDYCKGTKSFDQSHFYTLFMEGEAENGRRSEDELKTIFQFFPNSDQLLNRMNSLFSEFESIGNYEISIFNSAQKDIEEKKKILQEINELELIELIDSGISFKEKNNFDEESIQDDEDYHEFITSIDDYLNDRWKSQDKKYYALFEAFYGIVNDYQMVWYLGSPLIESSINLDHYFDIWKYGGLYTIRENEGVIVSRRVIN